VFKLENKIISFLKQIILKSMLKVWQETRHCTLAVWNLKQTIRFVLYLIEVIIHIVILYTSLFILFLRNIINLATLNSRWNKGHFVLWLCSILLCCLDVFCCVLFCCVCYDVFLCVCVFCLVSILLCCNVLCCAVPSFVVLVHKKWLCSHKEKNVYKNRHTFPRSSIS